jgi:ferrochelatase
MTAPTGILVLNLGGPRTLDDIRPFLGRLFADREIIRLPGGAVGQWLISRMILLARLPSVRRNYASIGGGSPILRFTTAQVQGLVDRVAAAQNGKGNETPTFKPYIAFRYTEPFADDALRAMYHDGVRDVVVLTLYPQYSTATTGSSLRDLSRALERTGLAGKFRFSTLDRWYEHSGFLDIMASRVREALQSWPADQRSKVVVVFSAHSLPLSFLEAGDPYHDQVQQTVRGILGRLGDELPSEHRLSFQSQTGPVRWLEPRTDTLLEELGRAGVRDALLAPVSFVSDHIETLFEVDQLFANVANEAGITTFRRTRSLNDDPRFLDVLANLVEPSLNGPWSERPV